MSPLPATPRSGGVGRGAPRRSAPPGHPDAARLAAAVARAYLEVVAGRRPLAQLSGALAPRVIGRIRLEAQREQRRRVEGRRGPAEGPGGVVVRRVVACWPTDDACEATAIVRRSGRTTAIALRIERHRGAWRVVELSGPEDGHRPTRTASITVPNGASFDPAAAEAAF